MFYEKNPSLIKPVRNLNEQWQNSPLVKIMPKFLFLIPHGLRWSKTFHVRGGETECLRTIR
jgi:hypothetical protein